MAEHQANNLNNNSSVMKHISETGHTMDWNWQISDKANTNQKLLLKEMLYIKKLKTKLNVQELLI